MASAARQKECFQTGNKGCQDAEFGHITKRTQGCVYSNTKDLLIKKQFI